MYIARMRRRVGWRERERDCVHNIILGVNHSSWYLFTLFHYRKFDDISFAPPHLMSSEHVNLGVG